MKSKEYAIYIKKSFVTIKTRKKSEIIAITLEDLEELLIVNVIVDSCTFMSTSLSNHVDNLSRVYDKECKKCIEKKLVEL